MTTALLAGAILAEVTGTLCLRASDGMRRRWWLVPMAVLYVLAFALLGAALAHGMPVGIAYGVWAAAGIALVALISRALWKDPLTPRMLVGIALIIVGVLLVDLG